MGHAVDRVLTSIPALRRAMRDEQLKAEIIRVWTANYAVYGAQEMAELNRQGIAVTRCNRSG